MIQDIKHTRWDTFIRSVRIENEDGTPVDITGSTITFSIKNSISDTIYILNKTFNITDAENGKAEILINWNEMELELKSYYYDIQWIDINWIITTILKWRFTILYDITN